MLIPLYDYAHVTGLKERQLMAAVSTGTRDIGVFGIANQTEYSGS